MAILKKIQIYPYSERANPKARGYVTPNGKAWQAWHPRGMEYWVLGLLDTELRW